MTYPQRARKKNLFFNALAQGQPENGRSENVSHAKQMPGNLLKTLNPAGALGLEIFLPCAGFAKSLPACPRLTARLQGAPHGQA